MIRVFALHCGQGDTVLLGIEERIWVLIDCHLPNGKIRDSFFTLVKRLNLRHLDVICLTHPHEDHFLGMLEVINYFTSEGRTLGKFCDSGLSAKEVLDLLKRTQRPRSAVKTFEALNNRLVDLFESKSIEYVRIDRNTEPIVQSRDGQKIVLASIAPDPALLKLSVHSAILGGSGYDPNDLSVALQLKYLSGTVAFEALFCGDIDGDGLQEAISRLDTPPKCLFVKVAHHGSLESHKGSPIAGLSNGPGSVAAVSVGDEFDVLPDREVLRSFLDNKWTVLLTTKRVRVPKNYAIQLIGRSVDVPIAEPHSLEVQWSEGPGLQWNPTGACITSDELGNYQSASD